MTQTETKFEYALRSRAADQRWYAGLFNGTDGHADTVGSALRFSTQTEASFVGVILWQRFGESYELVTLAGTLEGASARHGVRTWRVAEFQVLCEQCRNHWAEFEDLTFDREANPDQSPMKLCHSCASHAVEMQMMSASQVVH